MQEDRERSRSAEENREFDTEHVLFDMSIRQPREDSEYGLEPMILGFRGRSSLDTYIWKASVCRLLIKPGAWVMHLVSRERYPSCGPLECSEAKKQRRAIKGC